MLSKTTTTEQFVILATAIHGDKYDYSGSLYVDRNIKVLIKCPKHGDFYQSPSCHINRHQACPKCGIELIKLQNADKKLTNLEFINRAIIKHNNIYDYSDVVYLGYHIKVAIICGKHGVFWQIPANHLRGQKCPLCARELRNAHLTKNTGSFVDSAKIYHSDKYDYSLVEYINSKQNITIICKKHGLFTQIPNSHLNGKGCPQCAVDTIISKLTTPVEQVINLAKIVHNGIYQYDEASYISMHTKFKITCSTHGDFWQEPSYHISGYGCPKCVASKFQLDVASYISSLGISNVIFNDRRTISPKEIDILLPDYNLAIECHGLYWHSFDALETMDQKRKHLVKCDECLRHKIRLIQIYENEWLDKQDIVKSIIAHAVGKSIRIYARKCEIVDVSKYDHNRFMDENHIQGIRGATIIYGLVYNGDLVFVLSFAKHHRYDYEIMRSANKTGHVVVGGLNRLFLNFVRSYDPNSVMTYVCRRFFIGQSYKAIGFKNICVTTPNYFYMKRGKLYSRQSMQKHKLHNKLPCFNDVMSESANMFANGYRRIWDAGQLKLEWNNGKNC
jgi:Zn finger protein HypA/HybF involved in hydrogenase expression